MHRSRPHAEHARENEHALGGKPCFKTERMEAGMKTEIPKEDGWYWVTRLFSGAQMGRVFKDFGGTKSVMVAHADNPTTFTIYHHPEDLKGAIFTKIEVPI